MNRAAEPEPCTRGFDRPADCRRLMAAEIVHDDDIARLEGRDQEGLNLGEEGLAVDRPIEQTRRLDPLASQGGDEGQGLPAAERGVGLQPGTSGTPAAQRRHVGLGPGLVDEHQAGGVDPPLILLPLLTPPGDVGTILLLCEQAFF